MRRIRRFTAAELADRARQALLARTRSIPVLGDWVASGGRPWHGTEPPPNLFAGLHCLQPDPSQQTVPAPDVDLAAAGRMLLGRFPLLGLPDLDFGQPINWQLEPTSGRVSPPVPWKQLDSLDATRTGDKKVVWELNRHQHLVSLALAWNKTSDERYAAAAVEQMTSWIRANPPDIGINWVSSLELAFRSISWLWTLALLRSWPRMRDVPLPVIAKSLHEQATHVERFLSTYSSPNTHLTGEALGLYYIGCCVPGLRRAADWRALGRGILLQQLERQLQDDGVYFEQSSWYHRYTADFYTHFLLIARRSGEQLPAHVAARLEAMHDYLMWLTRPDGSSPYLGDDDGGKLIKLDCAAPSDWRATLSTAAVLFQRADFRHVAGRCFPESTQLLGSEATQRFATLPDRAPSALSHAFRSSGNFIMRSGWERDSHWATLDCGPHGVMNHGHSHADALALELAANGTSFLVDPGTFVYTGSLEDRDLFRSTAMHNTVTVDDQSSSVPAGPFKWTHPAQSNCLCWHDRETFTYFHGRHDGYRRLADPVTHARQLLFVNREYWLMLDELDCAASHQAAVHLHFAPAIRDVAALSPTRIRSTGTQAQLDIATFSKNGAWRVEDAFVSECYGARTAARQARYSFAVSGRTRLLTALLPGTPGQNAATTEPLQTQTGIGVAIGFAGMRDLALHEAGTCIAEGIAENDCEWLWLRRVQASGARELLMLHGSRAATQDLSIELSKAVEFCSLRIDAQIARLELASPRDLRLRLPANVTGIEINGRAFAVESAAGFSLPAADVPALQPSSSSTSQQWCSHVRH